MAQRVLILASASPRRHELLALGGWAFEVRPVEVVEIPHPGEGPADFVRRMSQTKARMAARGAPAGALVVGADTIVVLDGQILGKPRDAPQALGMLKQLRGRAHEVWTAIAVLDTADRPVGRVYTDLARSRVPMRAYGDEEIAAYVAGGDPLDKAGAYAVQHAGFHPMDREAFGDCLANVIGLPLCHLLRQLRRLGVESQAGDLPAACQRFIEYQCPVFEKILNEAA